MCVCLYVCMGVCVRDGGAEFQGLSQQMEAPELS